MARRLAPAISAGRTLPAPETGRSSRLSAAQRSAPLIPTITSSLFHVLLPRFAGRCRSLVFPRFETGRHSKAVVLFLNLPFDCVSIKIVQKQNYSRQGGFMRSFRGFVRASMCLAFSLLALLATAAVGQADSPKVTAVPGRPLLLLSVFDLAPLGYTTEEFFISGTASSYKLAGGQTPDGHWDAMPADTAPYTTRIVVVRPTDPKKFNGTVIVEWLNVSAGTDASPDWNAAHREMLRGGYAYVGVSAQKVGVEG